MAKPSLIEITALAKRRGYIFPGSEIYGGLANTYDYGPLGVELKNNIKQLWWKKFVLDRQDMVGIDSSIILNPKVWEASGHIAGFHDLVVDCKVCKNRLRADHLIENYYAGREKEIKVEGKPPKELSKIIQKEKIKCPTCGNSDLTDARVFNSLVPTKLGVLEEGKDEAYLRGETAQGIFINFKNIINSTRIKLPFGVGQIGKSFRNEITKGQFIFRTIEFEQAEIEYFFDPETQNWEELFDDWLISMKDFVTNSLGVNSKGIRVREHSDEERSFYSQKTLDLEYDFPFGFKELLGLAYRTNYDLTQHQKMSGKDLSYTDPHTGKKFIPHVIEPALGIDRLLLMVLCDAYWQDTKNNRTVLKIKPVLAPHTTAVFPLLKNNESLVLMARRIFDSLKETHRTTWDDRGNIGKRYFYQDEAGTPFCITVDHESLENNTVTVRDRDTMKQTRVAIDKLDSYISNELNK